MTLLRLAALAAALALPFGAPPPAHAQTPAPMAA